MSDPLLDSPLVQSIGWALIHFVWQGTAIGIATALTLRALAGARPATRYGVACFSLVLMLIVPVVAVLTDRVSDTATLAAPAAAVNVVTSVPLDRWLPSAVITWLHVPFDRRHSSFRWEPLTSMPPKSSISPAPPSTDTV